MYVRILSKATHTHTHTHIHGYIQEVFIHVNFKSIYLFISLPPYLSIYLYNLLHERCKKNKSNRTINNEKNQKK